MEKDKKEMEMENELTYTQVGDFLLPNIMLSESSTKPLGRYGRMRKEYLKETNETTYEGMLVTQELIPHCQSIQEQAEERKQLLIKQMAQAEGINEELKAKDPMSWVGSMNNIKARAEEIVLQEIIYS